MAALVPPGVSVADVGAGDGLLAAHLAARGHRVIATENKPGPLLVVKAALDPLGVECRLGDGLAPIRPGEVEVAILAGMGGARVRAILAAAPHVVRSLRALVVQPVQGAEAAVAALLEEGYREDAREEIVQAGRSYPAWRLLPPYSTGV